MRAAQEGGVTERADVTALLGVHWQVRAVGAQLTEALAALIAPTTQRGQLVHLEHRAMHLQVHVEHRAVNLQQRAMRPQHRAMDLQHRAMHLQHRAVT